MTVELIGIEGLPEVRQGDDLAALLERSLAAVPARERDVLAVTQKVVSKAEGRVVPADDRAGWIERESVGVVARERFERDRRHVPLAATPPRAPVGELWTGGTHEQHGSDDSVYELLEKVEQRRAGPVDVLDHDDDR